ncbi:protein scarlet-like [Thrips palmi]|uniref:Protein scarlet-like n=1 Tax=Thrips palmi TaxID=161013 RepID=A0A6P9A5C3_THRPL|nr:protein scarlet-like [Thrips palmi]
MESPGGSRGSGRGSPASSAGGATPPTPPGPEVALAQLQEDATSSMTLAWNDLSVWVRRRKEGAGLLSRQKYEHKQILNSVSGVAKSGTLMAIMGASGAGKTTLLATVSQRVKGIMRGEILVNGHVVDQQFMCKVSGFVPQQDLAVECLTVREHLEFMARLKMDQRVRASQRHRRILSLLMDLGLSKCCHTQLRRLSGGERRRVSLAVQLLTDPPFLFCDEPTTGLDSYSAGAVVEHLRLFAARGKAVICTIHQPASGIFDLFHQVLLVAGGRVAFFGDVADASRHFDNLGLVCPSTFNQAEFLVSQLAIIPGREGECLKKVQWLCDEFDNSKYGQALSDQLAAHTGRFLRSESHEADSDRADGLGHSLSRVGRSWSVASCDSYENSEEFQKYLNIKKPRRFTQFYWLVWRSLIEIRRQPTDILIRLGMLMFIAVLISTPYVSITRDQKGIQNMQGFLYLIVTEIIFAYSYSVFHTFPHEMPVLLREIGNGLYTPGPYYASKMLILLPRAIVEPFLYTLVVFLVGGLTGGITDFLLLLVPVWACAIAATAYGCLMSASFESIETAAMVSVPYEFISVTFSGLYIQLGNLPAHLAWVPFVSLFYYGNEAVSILQWEKIDSIACDEDPGIPCISSGQGALEKYGYHADDLGLDIAGLAGIYVFCHLFGFIALWRRSKRQAVY